MRRAKIIAALTLTVLVIVVVLQNTEPVETRLLFMTVTMPRAALLGLTVLVGFALGLLACLIGSRKRPGEASGSSREATPPAPPARG